MHYKKHCSRRNGHRQRGRRGVSRGSRFSQARQVRSGCGIFSSLMAPPPERDGEYDRNPRSACSHAATLRRAVASGPAAQPPNFPGPDWLGAWSVLPCAATVAHPASHTLGTTGALVEARHCTDPPTVTNGALGMQGRQVRAKCQRVLCRSPTREATGRMAAHWAAAGHSSFPRN